MAQYHLFHVSTQLLTAARNHRKFKTICNYSWSNACPLASTQKGDNFRWMWVVGELVNSMSNTDKIQMYLICFFFQIGPVSGEIRKILNFLVKLWI